MEPATFSPAVLLYIVAALLVACILQSLLYRLQLAYGSTLRDVPGPFHAKFTGLALKWHDVRGDRWHWVLRLHEKYGPTVRIAAEEVSVSDPADVRKLHALGTSYRKRQQPGTPFNIFSMSDPRQHRSRQRFYAKAFSPANVDKNLEPAIQKLSKIAIAGMREDAASSSGHIADMFKWSNVFGYDVAWQLVYGDAITNGLMARKQGVDKVLTGCYLQLQNSLMLFCFPAFLLGRMLGLFIPFFAYYFRVEHYYDDLVSEGPRQEKIGLSSTFWNDSANTARYCRSKAENDAFILDDGAQLSKFDVARDSTTFLGAGGQAIGTTLLFLIWVVLQDPELQSKLEQEVASLEEPITNEACGELELLNGTIYETLRLYGGGASHLPRYSDRAGQFGHYIIPPGIAVTSHHGALHRNPSAWNHPQKFDPYRWQYRSQAMVQDEFQPFNSGARMCIAIHFTLTQLRIFVATFFREFRGVRLAPSVTAESMRILDRFHIQPVSKQMEIVVPPL